MGRRILCRTLHTMAILQSPCKPQIFKPRVWYRRASAPPRGQTTAWPLLCKNSFVSPCPALFLMGRRGSPRKGAAASHSPGRDVSVLLANDTVSLSLLWPQNKGTTKFLTPWLLDLQEIRCRGVGCYTERVQAGVAHTWDRSVKNSSSQFCTFKY